MLTAMSNVRDSVVIAVAAVLLTWPAGCLTSGPTEVAPPTQADRLVRFYPELSGGRFVVLADFEDPAQMELFDFVRTSTASAMQLDSKAGRKETGGNGLRTVFASPADTLRINNDRATSWHLKRDWREYDLLLMSVYLPPTKPGGPVTATTPLEITLNSGTHSAMRSVTTSVPLITGWNSLRLDLADAGERIPLDDIRGLELTLPAANAAQTVHVDDILLAGYRVNVVGDSTNVDGKLYVERIGQRLHVGAGGQFEVVFGNGQLIGWYDLTNDSLRSRNLLDGALITPAAHAGESETAPIDRSRTTTRVIEANAVRAVIECGWRQDRDPATTAQRWTYVVYPTSQLYVSIDTSIQQLEKPSDSSPLAFSLQCGSSSHAEVRELPAQESGSARYAFFRDATNGPTALVAPGRTCWSLERTDNRTGKGSAILATLAPSRERTPATFHVWISSGQGVADHELQARAAAFMHATQPVIEVGTWLGNTADEAGTGNSAGCLIVEADESGASFTIDGRERPIFFPIIEIRGGANRTSWVYVNDRLTERVVRTADGSLLFQIPTIVRDRTRIEVLFGAVAEMQTEGRTPKK